MRRAAVATLIAILAVTLSAGAAIALSVIDCEDPGKKCVGTERSDLMRGTGRIDALYGREGGDTLKGFGESDALLGQQGDDALIGGTRQDFVIGGLGDDRLRGEDALDIYYFERSMWGRDTIVDALPARNILRLPDGEGFGGAVTTNLNSDSGPLPEVANPANGSTVNWKGDAIAIVIGSTGDDVVTGNGAANDIFDGEGRETDTDKISGAGGGDLIDVQDGAGDDTVACGAGRDTAYFDEGDELVVPGDCEQQNPIPFGPEERRATMYGAETPKQTPVDAPR